MKQQLNARSCFPNHAVMFRKALISLPSSSGSSRQLFGTPSLIPVSGDSVSYMELYKAVLSSSL